MPGNAGRKPDPTVLRILKGNPSGRPINENEPKPKKGPIKVPKHLDKAAASNFRRVKKIVEDMGILTSADQDILKRYAFLDARLNELMGKFDHEGTIYYKATTKERESLRRHPGWTALIEVAKACNAMGAELGLSPSMRTKIQAPGGEELDPIAQARRDRDA